MELLGVTKSKIINNKNGENVPHLEIIQVVLVHCNIFNNNYQQNSRVLCTFIPDELFGQLLDISPKISENVCLRILVYWSVVYWSKF